MVGDDGTMAPGDVPVQERITATPGALKRQPGATVGRGQWVNSAWEQLLAGSHLQVTGPRRLGKSQAVLAVTHAAPEEWEAVYVDLENASDLAGAVAELLEALRQHLPLGERATAAIGNLLARGVAAGPLKLAPGVADEPDRALRQAIRAIDETLSEQPGDRRLLLVCDEVADVVVNMVKRHQADGVEQATTLLQTLRACRQQHPRVAQVLLGSVGLRGVLERYGMGTVVINDLTSRSLGPLDRAGAKQFARRVLAGTLSAEATWDDATLQALWEATGGFALLTELTIQHLAQHVPTDGHVTAEVVATIHRQQVMLTGAAGEYFNHFVDRVSETYPNDSDVIYRVLDRAARHGRITLDDAAVYFPDRDVPQIVTHLRHLQADGYLTRLDEQRWQWAHRPLAEVWLLARPAPTDGEQDHGEQDEE